VARLIPKHRAAKAAAGEPAEQVMQLSGTGLQMTNGEIELGASEQKLKA
jgi:hypothetical protein